MSSVQSAGNGQIQSYKGSAKLIELSLGEELKGDNEVHNKKNSGKMESDAGSHKVDATRDALAIGARSFLSGPMAISRPENVRNPLSEFYCFLKTKRGQFKKHYMQICDNNILFYRRLTDTESRQAHPLGECHLRLAKPQHFEDGKGGLKVFYPVQADIPPDRTRLLYFDSEAL